MKCATGAAKPARSAPSTWIRLGLGEQRQLALQLREPLRPRLQSRQEIGDRDEMDRLARADELEVDAVGVDQVRIGLLVSPALLDRIALQPDDVLVDVLGLGPAHRHAVALEQEVRHPGFGLLGLVDDPDRGIDTPEQRVERGAVAVLGGVPAGVLRPELIEIVRNVHATPAPRPALSYRRRLCYATLALSTVDPFRVRRGLRGR